MSKFKVWVDDDNVSDNTLTFSEFESDSTREEGFQPNTAASAKKANSATRQANLIACAVVEALIPTNESLNLQSSVDDLKDAFVDALKELKVAQASDYDETNGTIKDKFDNVEERLAEMGFKEGELSGLSSGTVALSKLGKYIILEFDGNTVYRANFSYGEANVRLKLNDGTFLKSKNVIDLALPLSSGLGAIKFNAGADTGKLVIPGAGSGLANFGVNTTQIGIEVE